LNNKTSLPNNEWKILADNNNNNFVDLLLKNRQISNVENFLDPNFEKLYDPFLMKDMEAVIQRLEKAKQKEENIIIYGDYDTDGITSSLLLCETLEKFGLKNIEVFLPDRVYDGYGLNNKHFDEFKSKNISLIITVDNGIAAAKEVKEAKSLGIDVVITDHHIPQEIVPEALILNPLQKNCAYPDKYLCGVGIVFKLLQALGIKYPDIFTEVYIKWQLDLVAIGTVVDCAKLIGENRILVSCGLKVVKKTKRLGLKQIINFSNLAGKEIQSEDLGFKIGPKLNAAGRISSAKKAFDTLYCREEKKAIDCAFELQELNSERQNMVSEMLLESYSLIDHSNKFIFIKNDSWNAGLIGLLAGQLTSEFHKPAFVMCKTPEGIVASIRTPEINLNIVDVLAFHKNLLKKFGGHKSAAGFTIEEEHFEKLERALSKYFEENIKDKDLATSLIIDTELGAEDLTMKLLNEINKLAPFGIGNKAPKFILKNILLHKINLIGVKQNHLRMTFNFEGKYLQAIAFGFGKYYEELKQKLNKSMNLAFCPKLNNWKGQKSIDLHIIDIDFN